MKRVLIGIVLVIAVLVGLTFLLPANVQVERSTTINAPVELVYAQVDDFKKWPEWMPWIKKDPDMKISWGDKTQGEGASYSWTSENPEVGNGKLSFTKVEANRSLTTKLEFEGMNPGYGGWTFTPEGDATKVTWTMDSDMGMNPIGRVMGMFMDQMVGPDFEKGLAGIKTNSEKIATELEAAEAASIEMASDSTQIAE